MTSCVTNPAAPAVDPWPKHHRVYLVLRQQIRDGLYSDSTPFPSELLLAERFQVSRITLRKAMARLTSEGFIVRTPGRGTFVRGRQESPVQASIRGVLDNLIAMGLQTEVRVLGLLYEPASVEVAQALKILPGTTVQKAVRVRSHHGQPFSFLTTYVPEDLGRAYGAPDLRAQPLLLLLERAGAHIYRAEQSITALLAAPEVARELAMEPGDALLGIRRVVFDENDRPVEYIQGLYRPDTYEHTSAFDRLAGPEQPIWKI